MEGVDVAVKAMHLRSLPPHLKNELNPVFLANGHPDILTTYGICDYPGKFSQVTELMETSLGAWIEKLNQEGQAIFLSDRNQIGYKMARGLSYLHSKNITHKHLKDSNILLRFLPGIGIEVKLADADLSKLKLETSGNCSAAYEVTIRYRAPETFTREYGRLNGGDGRLNNEARLVAQKEADVYSLGVVVLQMQTMRKPYAEFSEAKVLQKLSAKEQEAIPDKTLPVTRAIIQAATDLVPAQRPSALEAQQAFEINEPLLKIQPLVRAVFSDQRFRDILPAIANNLCTAFGLDAIKHLAVNPKE